MTIRHRITTLIALVFAALSAIGAYAVYQARESAIKVHQVTQGVVPSALASADLVSEVKDIQLATMTLVYAPDHAMLDQARHTLETKEVALRASLATQARAAATQAQKGLAAQADESIGNYFSAIEETAKMKADGKEALAQAYLFADVAQYRNELEGIVETLRIEKNRQKDAAIAELNGALATTATAIAAVTGAVAMLLAAIGFMLYRQITRPLTQMQRAMSDIASSQDFTRRVPVRRMDEIGRSIVAFNGMIEKIEQSSAQLRQKTADIQAMLQNMPQGILTVIDGARVHVEYSAYLETIFETHEIAGRAVMDLVFADTTLGADTLSQVDAAIQACIGEDSINFEFNQHLLVGEVVRHMPDGRQKILDLSWSAITDETDTIARLMLCVRDVTKLRKLAQEATEQKRRLEIIGEILAVSQDKFHQFVESSTGFIHENERIIRQHEQPTGSAIAELFRNMHTIKGNARSYSLRHLTDIVHEAEQTYDALRRSNGDRWDPQALIDDLARVREALRDYATISETSLGRKGSAATHSPERYVVIEKAWIHDSLHLLDRADPADAGDMHTVRDALRQSLRLIGTETIGEALADTIASLPSLARELGKAEPQVRIDDNGYRVRMEASARLRHVFTHLMRNALDHGIEAPHERLTHGKPSAGAIDIEVGMDNDMLQITLEDDGRGLALARIREIALSRGLVESDAVLTDEAVAELIFRSGFPTAEQVTDVSGRGVGMDAVRTFIAREGGSIELRFTDNRRGEAYRQFQTIVSLPARLAVDSLGMALTAHEQRALDAVRD